MKAKNFLLVGGNFTNKGAEAMLKTVRQQILRQFPDATVFVICAYGEKEVAQREGFVPVHRNLPPNKHRWLARYKMAKAKILRLFGIKAVPYADKTPLDDLRRKVDSLYMGIDVSGYAYHDGRDYQQPLETIKAIRFCKRHGAKYVFMPQAWGSFDQPQVAANVKQMLGMGNAFFARDSVSGNYLARLLGKGVSEIPQCPDIAFALNKPDPAIGANLLEKAGRSQAVRQLLAVSPNMRVYERTEGEGTQNKYIVQLRHLMEYAIERLGMDVVLVPNEIFPAQNPRPDDSFLCALLHREINRKHCFLISGYRTAEEIKSIIGNADLLVASRFHSLIFALSQSIPAMAISWSHKYKELLGLFDMEKFVVEDADSKKDELLDLLHELYNAAELLAENVEKKLPEIQHRIAVPLSHIR